MSTATEMRDLYVAAEKAVLQGQAFEIAGRKLTRADLAEIRAGRREWQYSVDAEVAKAAGKPLGIAYASFRNCQ